MLINLRNALMAGKRLPYDAEVEWLYNDGLTQYINTGIVPTSLTEVSFGFDIVEPATNLFKTFGGTFIQNNTSAIYAILRHETTQGSNAYNFRVNYNSTINATLAVGSHDVVMNEHGTRALKVDGATIGTFTGSISVNLPIFLFCRNTSGVGETQYSIPIKLRYCKIKDDNGVLVRDFIPVRKGTVGYLYDRVTRKLFGNAGSGDFALGQDVVPVEYIESHGTEWIDTGYKHSEPCEYIIDINGTPTVNDRGILGSYTIANNSFVLGFYTRFIYGFNNPGQRIDSPIYPAVSDDFLISYRFGADARTLSVNGWTGTANGTTYNSQNVGVFASGPEGRYPSSIKCRYFKIKDANDETIHNFLPVRVGTDATSWEGAMMDVLTRRVYRNAGTGAFTYGNDLKYPIPAA